VALKGANSNGNDGQGGQTDYPTRRVKKKNLNGPDVQVGSREGSLQPSTHNNARRSREKDVQGIKEASSFLGYKGPRGGNV